MMVDFSAQKTFTKEGCSSSSFFFCPNRLKNNKKCMEISFKSIFKCGIVREDIKNNNNETTKLQPIFKQ